VSALLLGGFGAAAAALLGPRPGLLPVARGLLGAAIGLACLPLIALGIATVAERLRRLR
jgi:hypothetical protein